MHCEPAPQVDSYRSTSATCQQPSETAGTGSWLQTCYGISTQCCLLRRAGKSSNAEARVLLTAGSMKSSLPVFKPRYDVSTAMSSKVTAAFSTLLLHLGTSLILEQRSAICSWNHFKGDPLDVYADKGQAWQVLSPCPSVVAVSHASAKVQITHRRFRLEGIAAFRLGKRKISCRYTVLDTFGGRMENCTTLKRSSLTPHQIEYGMYFDFLQHRLNIGLRTQHTIWKQVSGPSFARTSPPSKLAK